MIIDVKDFDESFMAEIPNLKRKRGNPGTRKLKIYKDLVCAFDIETTAIDELQQSIMYVWQFQIDELYTVIGRTWDDFLTFLDKLKSTLKENEWLVIYDQNLSYEFSFLKGIYPFSSSEVFATDNRKILKCSMMDHFEFRCSLFLTNMTLRQFLQQMKVEHQKLELDYDEKRWPWTPLDQTTLDYSANDVIGLVEAIKAKMAHDGDDLYKIPLTSTGYVRNDSKRAYRHVVPGYVKKQLPDIHVYHMLEEAFRGGNTHANRLVAGDILHNVDSMDRSSSYPEVLINYKYPCDRWQQELDMSIDRVIQLITVRGKAVLMRIEFQNLRLRDPNWGCPYLSRDKCRDILDGVYDNGRILSCQRCSTTITDIDLKIILEEYDFDNAVPYDVYSNRYGYLPQSFRELVIHYYTQKTLLKGVKDPAVEYMYAKNKALLNSLYGMCAQNLCKRNLIYNGLTFEPDMSMSDEELLEKANKHAKMQYATGVWCTAYARMELEKGIRLAHEQGTFVYTDTDSVKYYGKVDFSKYNVEKIRLSKSNHAYATDPSGKVHYMGVYEVDGNYDQFVTLGAKKYAYLEDGHLHVTVSGVSKALGGPELEEAGGLKAFREGFIFRKAGGMEAIYNDDPPVKETVIEGHKVKITANCYLKPSTYTLGLAAEYRDLLLNCKLIKYRFSDINLIKGGHYE